MKKEKVIEMLKKEMSKKESFTMFDFYKVAHYGIDNLMTFSDFCKNVEVQEIPQYKIREITLEELCQLASREGGEEYYSDYSIDYYTENGKIYEREEYSESLYKIV